MTLAMDLFGTKDYPLPGQQELIALLEGVHYRNHKVMSSSHVTYQKTKKVLVGHHTTVGKDQIHGW